MTRFFLKRFYHETAAAVGIMVAFVLPVVITSVGLSVDLSRAYLVRDRLSRALDNSAISAVASGTTNAEIETRFTDFFNANYPDGALGDPYDFNIEESNQLYTVSAKADVQTTFMAMAGFNTITVEARTVVKKEVRGIEVALVLDNTGSMWSNNNIAALRTAATNFTNIMFDRVTEAGQLKISLVPYAAMVNPGSAAPAIVHNPFSTPYVVTSAYAPYSTTDNTAWKGCVYERSYPNDIRDTSTSVGGLWQPFRWADTAPLTPTNVNPRDNDWRNNNGTLNLAMPPAPMGGNSNNYRHPNLGCPTPIIPLNTNRNQLVTEVSRLTAWNRGGTMGNIGLAWGVRALSRDAPFTEGAPYSDTNWRKIIVMMTDGDNAVYCETAGNNCGSQNASDNTAYGRVGENRLGTTTRGGMLTAVNARMTETCTYAKSLGITVYTITFASALDNNTRNLYRDCATDPAKYFNAPTQSDLISIYQQIARDLSNLHIAE